MVKRKNEKLDWLAKPCSDLVFHYTTYTTALEKILRYGKIRFGELGNSPDPYEQCVWNFGRLYDGGSEEEYRKADKEVDSSIERIHKRTGFFCTANDELNLDNSPHDGRGYMRFTLWDRYADKQKGICFVFDKIKLQNTVTDEVTARIAEDFDGGKDVAYKFPPPNKMFPVHQLTFKITPSINKNGIENTILQRIKRFSKELLFTKYSTWESENEYRFVVICNDVVPFEVNISGSLIGIVLGVQFPNCYIPLIENAINKFQINAAEIDYDDYIIGKLNLTPLSCATKIRST